MNTSTLSYTQIQGSFHVVKFAEHYYLVQLEMTDVVCVEISPMMRNKNSTPKNIYMYGSTRTSIHLHMYTLTHTHTHTHPHTHTDSLEHFSTCWYNPHAVSPQWSQYSGLLWGMEAGLKSCTSVLPTYYHFHKHGLSFEGILVLCWWTQVNLGRWILNWVRIRNTLTLFRFVYL